MELNKIFSVATWKRINNVCVNNSRFFRKIYRKEFAVQNYVNQLLSSIYKTLRLVVESYQRFKEMYKITHTSTLYFNRLIAKN